MSRPLTAKARAFADAYAGPGTGSAAARTAGYSGGDHAMRVRASELLRDDRIRRRITDRLGLGALEQPTAPEVGRKAPPPVTTALRKGTGRGTATERIELVMGIGRNKKADAKARIAALRLAAELEGEIRTVAPGRRPAPIAVPAPEPAPSKKRDAPGGLRLVLNPADKERADV